MAEVRKIAAILAADVVGFSRMASVNEDRTLARLRVLRADVIDPIIASQNGRVFKRTGDGALVEFRSVVEAVRCAISVQNAMAERNVGTPEDQRIVFRIGIHLGDVVEEADGDLMGDGVNIAARLEGIAPPGAICLSEDAYRQVKGRLDLAVTDLGATQLKNIAEPVRAYSLQVGVAAVAKPAIHAKATEPKRRLTPAVLLAGIVALVVIAGGTWYFIAGRRVAPTVAAHLSIVVLPFANLSNDPGQDYFADGITENLTTDLSRIRNSFVIARNTAFALKGKAVDVRDIGKQLGVRYVLEGSVQREGTHVRVNAQLIDAQTGAHLWADRFENDITDLFKLQDDVVVRLANSLGNEFVKAEARGGARKANLDTIDLTMRGYTANMSYTRQPTKENLYRSRALFEQALAIDPHDADALGGDALTYMQELTSGWTNSATDYEAKILGQADLALAAAPDQVSAYWAKGVYLGITHRAQEGFDALDAGIAINPNSASLRAARAIVGAYLFRYEQMLSDTREALRLSPLDPFVGIWHWLSGFAELGLGHYERSIEENHRAVATGFGDFPPYRDLAAAYAMLGKLDEARAAVTEGRRINPSLTMKMVIATAPNVPALLEGLRKAGLPEE